MFGEKVNALTRFEKALRDPGLKQRAYLERANIHVADKDYQTAISELRKAVDVGDRDLPAALAVRYLLSRCYETMDNLEEALEQWEWISGKKPNYADVAAKLSQYSGLRADDTLKDFLIAPRDKAVQYCERIIGLLGLKVHQLISGRNETFEYSAYDGEKKIRRVGSGLCVIRIVRSSEPLGYEAIRGLYDQMRKMNASKSVCVTASKFTRNAVEFAQTRPIDLIDYESLTKILKRIDL
jgi:tetratricopeptide (TPR) repeat protein